MDIETKGLGAGSYPEPIEKETTNVKITLDIEYTIDKEVPRNWTDKDIWEDVRENMSDYISNGIMEDWEIEVQ